MMGWRSWLCRVLWLVGMVVLSWGLLTTEAAQALDAEVPEEAHFGVSKAIHLTAYLTLTLLLAGMDLPRGAFWGLVVFLALHADVTEYLQTFIPSRTGTPRDILIDHIGILLGVALTWWVWSRRRPRAPSADGGGGRPAG